jgi:hypothetical protein
MDSPKKTSNMLKEGTFIIRKTSRPPSAAKNNRIKESPDKKYREGRKSINDYLALSRSVGPSALGKLDVKAGLTTTCWCLYDSKNDK